MEDITYDFLDPTIILDELHEKFLASQSQEDLEQILTLLYHLEVYVAFNPSGDASVYQDKIDELNENFELDKLLQLDGEYSMLTGEGIGNVLPVYTEEPTLNDELSILYIPFMDAVVIAQKLKANGIIVNPDSTQFFISEEGFTVFNHMGHVEEEV